MATDGPRHARQRRIVSPGLSSRRITAVSELVERDCAEVLDGICEQGEADLVGVTPSAVEEILRLSSPVTYMRRTATRDTTLAGVHLDQGEKLVLFYGSANRDPRVFADPDSMDLRRAPNPHLAFGGPGSHSCLGAHLARAELSVMFRQLLTRFPDLEALGGPELPEARSVPPFEAVEHLRVRFTPRGPGAC